jgi:hypothetical protein
MAQSNSIPLAETCFETMECIKSANKFEFKSETLDRVKCALKNRAIEGFHDFHGPVDKTNSAKRPSGG